MNITYAMVTITNSVKLKKNGEARTSWLNMFLHMTDFLEDKLKDKMKTKNYIKHTDRFS